MLLGGAPLFATEIPKIDMSKLMGMGTEMYEVEDGFYLMATAIFDLNEDGYEDAKFVYQFIPYDENRFATRIFEYMIDWNKNGTYEEIEKVRVEYDNNN